MDMTRWDRHVGVILKKCMLGAGVVLIISILSKSKAFYIAGFSPFFLQLRSNCSCDCFSAKRPKRYKNGFVWSMVTDSLCHLFSCCLCAVTRMSMWSCLESQRLCWVVAAAGLIYGWQLFQS